MIVCRRQAHAYTYYKMVLYWLCFNSAQALEAPSQVIGVSLSKHLRRGRPILLVTWTAPQSDVTITWYRIQYKRSGTLFWGSQATITGSPPSTTHVLISLEPGTNYTVRMRAESALGAGVWSEEQIERTFGREFLCIICVITCICICGSYSFNAVLIVSFVYPCCMGAQLFGISFSSHNCN